jgi:hypothetical protein
MAPSTFSKRRADAVARELDVGLDVGICHACLSLVSFALDDPPATLSGHVRRMTPILWDEGLAEPALAAARRARDRGVRDGSAALTDLELNGGRSATARAIVRRLAAELERRSRMETYLEATRRDRPSAARPNWN